MNTPWVIEANKELRKLNPDLDFVKVLTPYAYAQAGLTTFQELKGLMNPGSKAGNKSIITGVSSIPLERILPPNLNTLPLEISRECCPLYSRRLFQSALDDQGIEKEARHGQ